MPPILIIALGSFGMCVLLANRALIKGWLRSRSWKSTTARIVEDRDEVIWAYKSAYPARQARMVQVHAKSYSYKYEVGGHAYCTNRLGLGDECITHEHFRIGEKVTAYYDPENPQNAVLIRDFPGGASFGLIVIGVAVLCLLWRVIVT